MRDILIFKNLKLVIKVQCIFRMSAGNGFFRKGSEGKEKRIEIVALYWQTGI